MKTGMKQRECSGLLNTLKTRETDMAKKRSAAYGGRRSFMMKRNYVRTALRALLGAGAIALVFTLAACGSGPAAGGGVPAPAAQAPASDPRVDRLDAVISESFDKLTARFAAGARIALLPLDKKTGEDGGYVYDGMYSTLDNALTYTVVDRKDVEKVLAEQNFQVSGLVDDDTAVGLGHLLGAEVIIIGEINGTGSMRRLVFRALDVRTAKVVGSSMIRL
jgi:hypothetical protein